MSLRCYKRVCEEQCNMRINGCLLVACFKCALVLSGRF